MSAMIEIDLRPDERTLRQFGFIACAGFAALAAAAWFEGLIFAFGLGAARPWVSGALAGLGLVSGLFSLARPAANRALYVGLTIVSYPIGLVLSYVVLGALFYGLISPLGLFFRLVGRDSLKRDFETQSESYWQPARPQRSREHYFRQF